MVLLWLAERLVSRRAFKQNVYALFYALHVTF